MTRKEARETEAMLERLASTLEANAAPMWRGRAQARSDAEALRRISMTLRRWHELECGDSNDYASWAIERDGDEPDSKPYVVTHPHGRHGEPIKSRRTPIADRETGAKKRLAQIIARYPMLTAYVQTDPRGCALYILRPSDVPEGADVSSYYSRGVAVFK